VVAEEEDLLPHRLAPALALDRDLPDPVDVPPVIAEVGDVVLVPAGGKALLATLDAPVEVDHHSPPLPLAGRRLFRRRQLG